MKATRFIDSILERHLIDIQNETVEKMQALIDYNIMMGNIEDPAEDEEEPEENEGSVEEQEETEEPEEEVAEEEVV